MNRAPRAANQDEPPRRQDAKAVEPDREHDRIARQIVDSAFAVHRALGPGLLESVYEQCLVCELSARGLTVRRQVVVPVFYRGIRMDTGLRLDLLVDSWLKSRPSNGFCQFTKRSC